MKTISILLLFAIVAITLEKVTAEFMLVEIEDEEEKGMLYLFCTHQVKNIFMKLCRELESNGKNSL